MAIDYTAEPAARIWMVNQYAITSERSGGTRHLSLAKRLVKYGWQVSIIASKSHHQSIEEHAGSQSMETETVEGVTFYWLKLPKYYGNSLKRIWNMLSFAVLLFKFLFSKSPKKPDLIYGSSPHLFGAFSSLIIAKILRVPFVLEVRDLWPQTFIDLGGYSKWHPFIWGNLILETILYRNADRIITLLPGSEKHMKSKGANINRISWVPNGIDFSMLDMPSQPSVNNQKEFNCVYAGAHGLANALDTILDTAKIVSEHSEGSGITFELYGEGPERARLDDRVKNEGIENISILGPVSKKDIYQVIQRSAVMLESKQDTSLYKWGMSFNKIFDYFACKKPVIIGLAADYNPVAECNAGRVVPPEDPQAMAAAILELKKMSSESLVSMGELGYEYVRQHHDFEDLASKLDTLLKELV